MGISYEHFISNYLRYKVGEKNVGDLIEDSFRFFQEFNFIKNHNEFYPVNLFTDEEIYLYFFTNGKIFEIKISEDNVQFEVFEHKNILNVKLTYFSFDRLLLDISFNNDKKLTFDNSKDANEYNASGHLQKIINIHKLLVGEL